MDHSFVHPAYQSQSIANIPATVAALLGSPYSGLPPLPEELWRPLLGGSSSVRRVVVLLVDGMGANLVKSAEEDVAWLAEQALAQGELTSVFPSTTVAALSSLWTGAAPAQHGLVGLQMFFPEYAVMGQMLSLSPVFQRSPDALVNAGLEPESFLQAPGFGDQLAAAGIPAYALKHYTIANSALSRMHGRGTVKDVSTVAASDTFWRVRHLLENNPEEPMYIFAYWSAVDTLEHVYGYDHDAVRTELRSVLTLLQRELLEKLGPDGRRDTALLVTADHGQVQTPPQQRVFLDDHPDLQRLLLMAPAGEPRTAYLYARQGHQQDVLDYVQSELGHAAQVMAAQEALSEGLLGPLPHASDTPRRVGDVVMTMREGYSFLSRDTPQFLIEMNGRHGGLTGAEMTVPWFALRLDA
jgi:hypothetical protein